MTRYSEGNINALVEPIEPKPGVHRNCTVGRCKHRGQYRILIDHKMIQVCLPHASKYCKKYGLELPPSQV